MLKQDFQQIQADLAQWLLDCGAAPESMKALPGDAGFRRYWRLTTPFQGRDVIAVYGPPDKEKNAEFVAIANFLQQQGMPAPRVFASDLARGFMLVEDLGTQHLFDVLSPANVDALYLQAMEDLARFSQAPQPEFLALYDAAAIRQEMELLREWFIDKLLGYALDADESTMLDILFEKLTASALEQPQVVVLRDFHSRNIMLRKEAGCDSVAPAYIDFQDALWGPCSYDLVSLLRDCYVRWSPEQVEQWCEQYRILWQRANGQSVDPGQFKTWFDWMGLQRHIKVLGIFARLFLRDDKRAYLDDLPLVIRYTLDVAEQYPECQAFAEWFKQTLIPIAEQQDWYQDYRRAGESGAHLTRS